MGVPGRGGGDSARFHGQLSWEAREGNRYFVCFDGSLSSFPGIVLPACPGHEHRDQNSFEVTQ